jgi:pimeloyl-ACP methyl ester carboxylesterase
MNELEPIQVRLHGSAGPKVVVLHGGPGAPGSAVGLAQALAPAFQVLEPLQRRSGSVPLTVARHVEDLAVVVPRPAILIGWSWGAMLALSFAARYPERVSDLILIGCGTYDESSRALLRHALDKRLSEAERSHIEALQKRLDLEQDPATRNSLFGEIGAAFTRAESYNLIDEAAPLIESDLPDENGHVETWKDVLRLQREAIEPNVFSAIMARVLMLHGYADPHPGPATRDLLRRFIPQIEYVGLELCGHEPWREQHARERFLQRLRQWLFRK